MRETVVEEVNVFQGFKDSRDGLNREVRLTLVSGGDSCV